MKNRLLISFGISFVLALLMINVWGDLVRELILLPISYLIWIGGLLYRSFDQRALWTSLIIIIVLISWASLKLKRSADKPENKNLDLFLNRIEIWSKRLKDVHRGTYMQWRLAQHLSGLVLDSLAYRAGLTREQIDQKILSGTLNIPDDIQAYLLAARGFEVADSMSGRKFFSSVPRPLDLPPERIAEFIENYLAVGE